MSNSAICKIPHHVIVNSLRTRLSAKILTYYTLMNTAPFHLKITGTSQIEFRVDNGRIDVNSPSQLK